MPNGAAEVGGWAQGAAAAGGLGGGARIGGGGGLDGFAMGRPYVRGGSSASNSSGGNAGSYGSSSGKACAAHHAHRLAGHVGHAGHAEHIGQAEYARHAGHAGHDGHAGHSGYAWHCGGSGHGGGHNGVHHGGGNGKAWGIDPGLKELLAQVAPQARIFEAAPPPELAPRGGRGFGETLGGASASSSLAASQVGRNAPTYQYGNGSANGGGWGQQSPMARQARGATGGYDNYGHSGDYGTYGANGGCGFTVYAGGGGAAGGSGCGGGGRGYEGWGGAAAETGSLPVTTKIKSRNKISTPALASSSGAYTACADGGVSGLEEPAIKKDPVAPPPRKPQNEEDDDEAAFMAHWKGLFSGASPLLDGSAKDPFKEDLRRRSQVVWKKKGDRAGHRARYKKRQLRRIHDGSDSEEEGANKGDSEERASWQAAGRPNGQLPSAGSSDESPRSLDGDGASDAALPASAEPANPNPSEYWLDPMACQ